MVDAIYLELLVSTYIKHLSWYLLFCALLLTVVLIISGFHEFYLSPCTYYDQAYKVNYPCCEWWNRELILKCKLKCYVKPMNDPLGVSPSKGNQGTTRGKE